MSPPPTPLFSPAKPLRVMGIDPGLHGAFTVMEYAEGRYNVLCCQPLPITETLSGKDQLDIREFSSSLSTWQALDLCTVEQQGPRAEDKLSSVFTLGRFFGRLECILSLSMTPTVFPTPQTWKKVVFAGTGVPLGKTREEQKKAAIALVSSLYPSLSLRRTRLSRTDDDNMAESVCLAHYSLKYLHLSLPPAV